MVTNVRNYAPIILIAVILGASSVYLYYRWFSTSTQDKIIEGELIDLPDPRFESEVSLEEAILRRRSTREFSNKPVTIKEVSQLLWAAQGITSERGYRTAPSAGALYPLEVYVVVGYVDDLSLGVYWYRPSEHALVKVTGGDVVRGLTEAALMQQSVSEAAVNLVITAVYSGTTQKYGDRGVRYIHLEAGHAAQNICLQATALDLGAVTVGSFSDEGVKWTLKLPEEEQPLYIIPVGRK
jgi:SagB-type dehydrogenase family enzyme